MAVAADALWEQVRAWVAGSRKQPPGAGVGAVRAAACAGGRAMLPMVGAVVPWPVGIRIRSASPIAISAVSARTAPGRAAILRRSGEVCCC